MNLDERDRAILNFLGPDGLRPIKFLFSAIPKQAVYTRLKKLIRAGLVYKEGNQYGLLPAGREALAAPVGAEATDGEPSIARFVPHVALGPTAVHRALLTLIAAAVVARRWRLRDSHHPTFVLVGPKLRWKTWTSCVSCWMVGIDPREHVLNLGLETAGSLLQRRGATGQVVSKRVAVDQPVIGLDELGRAKPGVLGAVKSLCCGDLSTPFENETIELRCVPVIMLNPRTRKDGAELTAVLGLDEGAVRRAVIGNLEQIQIPEAILDSGDERLDRARALGAAEFPRPRDPAWAPQAEVKAALLAAFDSRERLADVDVSMVTLLVTALTAWLKPAEALRLGVVSYLTMVETLGWCRADWRQQVITIGQPSPEPRPDSANSTRASGFKLRGASMFSYTAKAQTMLEACRRLGLEPKAAEALLERVQRVGLPEISQALALQAGCTEAGLSTEEALQMVAAAREAASVAGISNGKASGFALGVVNTVAATIARKSADSPALGAATLEIVSEAADLADLRRKAAKAIQHARAMDALSTKAEARSKQVSAEADRVATEARARQTQLQRKLQELRAERDQLKGEIARQSALLKEAGSMVDGLRTQHAAMQRDIARATEIVGFLGGALRPYGVVARELLACFEAAKQGRLDRSGLVSLSGETKRAVWDAYTEQLERDGDLVPTWQKDEFKRAALKAAAAELKQRFESPAQAVKSLEEAIRPIREAAESAVRDLASIEAWGR